tara:strand:+ start:650 stop:1606 length:957 start_codon:yes stop_codon:yes gene_type:complete
MKKNILITGVNGQVGTKLFDFLNQLSGYKIISSDIGENRYNFPNYKNLDVTDRKSITNVIKRYEINEIYHLAAILSSTGEQNNQLAWEVNMNGLMNVLSAARDCKVSRLFYPSSIAVFGGPFPNGIAHQNLLSTPTTMYGINKLAGENLCNYFSMKFGLDIRSLRYPGIIGPENNAGGGTTDYAVEIFHDAVERGSYRCFLSEHTILPMIYIDDAIRATLEIMKADESKIKIKTSYNLAGFSFSPFQLSQEIKNLIPNFKISYYTDHRQAIADSWPQKINDDAAKNDWGWQPKFGIREMTSTIIDSITLNNYTNSNSA